MDALENQQLEAEKAARRLRVERQALKSMLPDVVRSEVRAGVNLLAEGCEADHVAFSKYVDELIALDQKRLDIYVQMETIQDRLDAAMVKARSLTGAGRVGAHGEARGEESIISQGPYPGAARTVNERRP